MGLIPIQLCLCIPWAQGQLTQPQDQPPIKLEILGPRRLMAAMHTVMLQDVLVVAGYVPTRLLAVDVQRLVGGQKACLACTPLTWLEVATEAACQAWGR